MPTAVLPAPHEPVVVAARGRRDGVTVEPADGRQEFPTRADAESWIGEFWAELAEEGVAAVTLFEGEREVYGPMRLDTQ